MDHDQWEISQIRQDFSSLRNSTITHQDAVNARIGNLLRRVSRLEERLETAMGRIDFFRDVIAGQETRIAELEQKIEELCSWVGTP